MKESKKWKEVFKDILGYENNGHVQLFCKMDLSSING